MICIRNKEKARKYQKEYRRKNHKKLSEMQKKYYYKHRKNLLIKMRKCHKNYWLKNRDKINKNHRKYYRKTNGEWHKIYSQNHKSQISTRNKKYYYKIIRKRKGIKKFIIKWKKWEDNILKKYYGKIITSEIKKRYLKNRNLSSIRTRANKNLNLRTYIRMSDKHKKILALRNKKNIGKTYEEIYGKDKARKLKEKFSLISTGENNPAYKDGSSKFPYPLEWRESLKEQIRQRDRKCQICKKQDKLRKLCVHHIDRNKNNLNPNNLISLCLFHHAKIINIQDDLKDYFQSKILLNS